MRHGEHDPHLGWYDASLRAYVSSPDKLTKMQPAPPEPTEADHQRWAESKWSGPKFRPQPQLEQLLRWRDSDRAEEREQFNRMVHGQTRMTLHNYETERRAHLAAGGTVE